MNEKFFIWTNEQCENCLGWVIFDSAKDEFFCEDCGLVRE